MRHRHPQAPGSRACSCSERFSAGSACASHPAFVVSGSIGLPAPGNDNECTDRLLPACRGPGQRLQQLRDLIGIVEDSRRHTHARAGRQRGPVNGEYSRQQRVHELSHDRRNNRGGRNTSSADSPSAGVAHTRRQRHRAPVAVLELNHIACDVVLSGDLPPVGFIERELSRRRRGRAGNFAVAVPVESAAAATAPVMIRISAVERGFIRRIYCRTISGGTRGVPGNVKTRQ